LNGKLDLTQAEAVADVIASNTEASRKTALQNMRGGFSNILKELREQLLKFSALIELELDFSQEDVEFADRSQLYELITSAEKTTGESIAIFSTGQCDQQWCAGGYYRETQCRKINVIKYFIE
jgi:tRNA modification GTPase